MGARPLLLPVLIIDVYQLDLSLLGGVIVTADRIRIFFRSCVSVLDVKHILAEPSRWQTVHITVVTYADIGAFIAVDSVCGHRLTSTHSPSVARPLVHTCNP